MGKTRIFTTIQMEIGEPNLSQPHQGGLFFEVDFCPMASPYFEAERRNHESVLTLRMIERILFYSKAVDREALCISAGQLVSCNSVDNAAPLKFICSHCDKNNLCSENGNILYIPSLQRM